ncbi:MAG: class I tRNA ligase family protein [Candidatus Beckwithbacteria bacterium]|nr:class I tRNA ligase family protein [Candidatus Beckwithbacteria bacterium]
MSPRSREITAQELGKFPHQVIETKWMNRWVEDRLYRAKDDSPKPKAFILDMYPYPSGAGLHVGHVEGYTATDILSRYKRMNGFEVLHPMGWDAFGLPTENFAIKTGKNPHKVTEENADVFRKQCIRTGFSIDWAREIDTSKAEFYQFTQSIFLALYEKGLAYKSEAPVNWCTDCKTVLANEQVNDGHCERCNTEVVTRNIEQWFFKITAYADRLIADLDSLDWPESTKEGQRNWIGRTEGVEIQVDLEQTEGNLVVFTPEPESFNRPGYIVMAPEHPNLNKIVVNQNRKEVADYLTAVASKSELSRKQQKDRTGVFTGNSATNPLTGDHMEIWVADYVLMNQSDGIRLEQLQDNQAGKTNSADREKTLRRLGRKARPAIRYKLRDWLISRERYWGAPIPIVHCQSCGDQPVSENQLPVLLPEMADFTPTGEPPLAKSKQFLHTQCPNCHGPAERETKTLDTFVDSAWYYMRFADPHNHQSIGSKQLLKKWLPVDFYIGGADHTTGHLLYARFITKVLYDLGVINFNEPFTKLTHQGMILGADGRKMSKRWGNAVNPLDVANEFGSDALRLYEMFLGPLEQSKVWDNKALVGPRRFVDKVWQLPQKVYDENPSAEEIKTTNILIDRITGAIEAGKYNVAVSDFMKYLNFIEQSRKISHQSYETFLKLLAPFAPFIAEELWERVGNRYSIHQSEWPQAIADKGIGQTISLPVMINGKVKGTIPQPAGVEYTQEEIMAILKADPGLANELKDLKVKRIIYKQGKIFNILT